MASRCHHNGRCEAHRRRLGSKGVNCLPNFPPFCQLKIPPPLLSFSSLSRPRRRGCGSCGNPGGWWSGGRDFQRLREGPGAGGRAQRSFPQPVSFHSPGGGPRGGWGQQARQRAAARLLADAAVSRGHSRKSTRQNAPGATISTRRISRYLPNRGCNRVTLPAQWRLTLSPDRHAQLTASRSASGGLVKGSLRVSRPALRFSLSR
jgi:hypothetical protein